MTRLIDADALTEVLETMAKDKWNQQVGSSKGLEDAIDVIENAPTVEPERTRGEWIEIPVKRDLLYNTGIKYTCSICNRGNCYGKTPFCMYCGAEMRKEDRKNECL